MFNFSKIASNRNANFYYALTLVHMMAQIHLIVDSISAVLKNDYWAKHPPDEDEENSDNEDDKKTQ